MPERFSYFRPSKPRRREGRPNFYQRGYRGKHWQATRKRVLERDNFQCQTCGRIVGDIPGDAQVDHVIPKRITQSDNPDGLQTLCRSCHSKKTCQERKMLSEATG